MSNQEWIDRAHRLGPEMREYARRHDEDGSFVEESFEALLADGYFAALVPSELGGMGATLEEICHFLRVLAHYCPSTALAFSMHTHLVATTVWKYKKGQPVGGLLQKVAGEDAILISTGAGDWLESNGRMEKVKGGYRYFAQKPFASGSPAGTTMITSGQYDDPNDGPRVLHFALPFSCEGVQRGSDWDTHGMRGTGSSTVTIDGAFVPEESISLNRPRGPWHPAFDVVCTVALPILMSPYVGVAERAAELSLSLARHKSEDLDTQYLSGELSIGRAAATALWEAQVANAANYEFVPSAERTEKSVALKTALAEACLKVTEKAMELGGGAAFFRRSGIEQCLRDVRGAIYHPLQPKKAAHACGRLALGLALHFANGEHKATGEVSLVR